MPTVYNGMSAADLTGVSWHKSQHSQVTDCVELARLVDGTIAMRNSRFPSGPALIYTQGEITAMLLGAKSGDFDQFMG
jgi:Domain of unknown function (DUF397)